MYQINNIVNIVEDYGDVIEVRITDVIGDPFGIDPVKYVGVLNKYDLKKKVYNFEETAIVKPQVEKKETYNYWFTDDVLLQEFRRFTIAKGEQDVPKVENQKTILNADDNRRNITIPHYTSAQDVQQLYYFTIPHIAGKNIILTPFMEDVLVFKDENGATWYNQYKFPNVRHWGVPDTLGTYWMRSDEYLKRMLLTPKPKLSPYRTRKKLRMKYDSMPTIKEETYYATKDYIA